MTEITIIIPSYNSGMNLVSCIQSLKSQKIRDVDYDIIVVDSSTDGTPDLVKAKFPDLKIMHSSIRLLPGGARNLGIKQASGKLIAFIDSDCIAERDWLDNLVKVIKRLDCDVLGGAIKTLTAYHVFGAVSYLTEFSEFMPGRPVEKAGFIPTCNMICKKDIFDKAGMFLDDRLSGEDKIFGEKVWETGGAIYFCPTAIIWHNDRKNFTAFIKHQVSLGFASAEARREKKMEGAILLKLPFLIPFIPFIRLFRLFYRLVRYQESRYFIFACLNIFLIFSAYCVWTFGFIKGVLHKEKN